MPHHQQHLHAQHRRAIFQASDDLRVDQISRDPNHKDMSDRLVEDQLHRHARIRTGEHRRKRLLLVDGVRLAESSSPPRNSSVDRPQIACCRPSVVCSAASGVAGILVAAQANRGLQAGKRHWPQQENSGGKGSESSSGPPKPNNLVRSHYKRGSRPIGPTISNSDDLRPRQLRLLHLQPRPVHRRARREGDRRQTKRRAHARRSRRSPTLAHHPLARPLHPAGRRHPHPAHPASRRTPRRRADPHPRRLPRSSGHRRGLRRRSRPRPQAHARQNLAPSSTTTAASSATSRSP